MFLKKMHVRKRPLDGCCTKDQQIEIFRTLYAKAAKERDEAIAENKRLREALFLASAGFEL